MRPTRILLVDPQPVVCAGLGSLIAGFGPEWEICGSASDGFEAVAQAVECGPDVVIMEYEQPHLDGLGVARELGKRLCRVEVLIFSEVTSGV